jgi:hypothetical protein
MELLNYIAGIGTELHFEFESFGILGVKPMHLNSLHFPNAFFLERKWATFAKQNRGFGAHLYPTFLMRYIFQTGNIRYTVFFNVETGYLSRYNDRLRAGRPEFDSRQKQEIFSISHRPDRLCGPHNLLSKITNGSFLRVKAAVS